jgi:hypothetical protein
MVWTLRRGGWPRYIATTLAALYRQVFGVKQVQGLDHDFVFVPSREPPLLRRRRRNRAGAKAATAAAAAALAAAPAPAAVADDAGGVADAAAAVAEDAADRLPSPSKAADAAADATAPLLDGADAAAGASPVAGASPQRLQAVREEDDSGPDYPDEEEDDDGRDPMAATRQAVLASCATVPASGAAAAAACAAGRGLEGIITYFEGLAGGGERAGAGGGGAAGRIAGGAAVAGEAELMAAAAPPAVQDSRGVLRVAAVALGRSLSYRPSLQPSVPLEMFASGASFSSSVAADGAGGNAPFLVSPSPTSPAPPRLGLTRSTSMSVARAGTPGGGGLGKASRSVVLPKTQLSGGVSGAPPATPPAQQAQRAESG